ncbi:MAG: L-rhamnose mutarotase [Stygiobacter sp. RIFOXYC12_FULL_38_8]|nr:MAG: L-rhamnose mutarotase [Stygiobacter sp. RIFOXYB2_FULL_37_11]OGV11493.1 MAG: L-rhamnose mutarotase [Stygiobacter sp. RIFOXYA2_FULL_38_8]OGV15013.1 MAG: L-rhamnose mutarotase [Stygiobacter sp. RIFOXYC2_FULL_38_25]OGV22106.1 MAG: L-rhamnose mutarotase [Stygiobacter sp. RIFOXYC12_FULL_38_8]OGV79587.1 MAG: L-rhamnose mutarotase [Stygiobacter sp. GWF2_38_21]
MTSKKRYCKTLQLKNDPKLIEEYVKVHSMGNVWKEITDGIKEVGIIDMEIYLHNTTLFMIMDTAETFNHDEAMTKLGNLSRQKEWEAFVSQFQKTSTDSSANEKWLLMERIFKLDQKLVETATEGYLEVEQ